LPHKVHQHKKKEPKRRISDEKRGYFFPGEVARILKLDGIDYRQLRQLFRYASGQAPSRATAGKWARFTYRDLVAVKTAIRLAGGIGSLRVGRRLRLKRVEKAAKALRRRLGVSDPFAAVKVVLDGGTILAQLNGITFDAISGQLLLSVDNGIERVIEDIPQDLQDCLETEKKQVQDGAGHDGDGLSAKVPLPGIGRG
jgi:hypothetical protein